MIFKYQQGGATNLPFVNYQPVIISDKRTTATQEEALAAKATKQSESGQLTSKDLYTMLKEKLKGLPSDVNMAMQQLQDLEQLANIDFDGSTTQSLESKYLSILGTMNNLTFSREQYDDAMKTAKENGGLNEAAINQYGQVYMTNGKEYKMMSPEEAKQSGWIPVTNQDLLYMRANDLSMAGNDKLYNIVNNSIGIEKVNELINKAISGLGTDERTQTGYVGIDQQQILSGVNIIKQAFEKGVLQEGLSEMSMEGLYKAKLITKDQLNQSKLAINYIIQTLPQNAKTLLKLRSDGTDKGMQTLVASLIGSKNSNSTDLDLTYQDDLNTDGTKKKDSIKDTSEERTLAEMFQLDRGDQVQFNIQDGTTDTLQVTATRVPGLTKDGNPLGITTLNNFAEKSALGGILNFSQVTMGDQTLDMAAAQNIAVDASSVYKMYLPIDQEKASRGIIAPNLGYLKTLEKVRNEAKSAKNAQEINAIYKKYNLPPFVNPDGSVNESYYRPFGVMNATALSDAFNKGASLDSDFLEEVTDDNEINNYWSILKGQNSKTQMDKKSVFDSVASLWGGGSWQSMYKGQVYIPLTSLNPVAGAYSGGRQMKDKEYQDTTMKFQQNERLQTFQPQGQL